MTTVLCRSCSAPVYMMITATGKRMPVDPAPVANGNLAIDGEHCRVIKKDETYEGDRYVSHFATCADAAKFRKKPNADQHQA